MRKKITLIIIAYCLIVPLLWGWENIDLLLPLQYLDEVIAIFGLFYLLRHWSVLSKNEKNIVITGICLLVVGLIGTIRSKLQTGLFPISLDAFLCVKCFIAFIYTNHVIFNMEDRDKVMIVDRVNILLIPFLIIAFGFALLNLVTDIGMHDTVRHGMRAFMFLCRKSGTFSDLFFYYFIFLTIGYKLTKRKKIYFIIIVIALITWMLTLRTRSMVYVPLYFVMFYWLIIKGRQIRLNIGLLIIIGLIVFIFGAEKIESTYKYEDSGPRAILLFYGMKTMEKNMPVGAGFGTYGTDVACKYYSPLYYEYNFHHLWGLAPDNPMFAHDNYWPAIMGEYGIIGVMLVIIILFYMGKDIYFRYKNNTVSSMVCLFLYLTLILTSMAAPAFFSASTVFLFVMMPLAHISYFNENKII